METSEYFDNYSPENTPQAPQTPPEPFGKPRPSWAKRLVLGITKALAYFAIYLGVQVIVGFVYGIILTAQVAEQADGIDEIKALANELLTARTMEMMIVIDLIFLAAVALIFFLRRRNSLSFRQNLGLRNPVPVGRLGMIFAMGVTLNYAITIPLGILQNMMPEDVVEDYNKTQEIYNSGGLMIFIISGVILAPIVEELLFRGLISTRLSRGMPAWIVVLISAVGFGVMHGSLIQALYASLLGILLGVVFFRENSLIASVTLHFAFNFASLLPSILSRNEELANSEVVNMLFGLFALLCIPIGIVLLIFYLLIEKKKAPAGPDAPGVNGWLMRE